MVGTDARMRVSSVMVFPSSGTFRSHRTSTLGCRFDIFWGVLSVQFGGEWGGGTS